MNRSALFLSLLLAAAPAAASQAAAVADVRVTIGPELREKGEEYGQRDLDRLAAELEADVEKALAQRGRLTGGTLELVLVDAKPSRPTFEQMGRTPGLSMQSVSNGGATIEGVEITADGARRPVKYSWYETDIRWGRAKTVWTDAEHAFDRFARQYADGKR